MAELSDADKRAIYGDDYETIMSRERNLTKAPVTNADKRRALAAHLDKNETGRISAFAIAFTGFCLLLGSMYRTKGVDIAGWIGIAFFVLGVLWFIQLMRSARMWRDRLAHVPEDANETAYVPAGEAARAQLLKGGGEA